MRLGSIPKWQDKHKCVIIASLCLTTPHRFLPQFVCIHFILCKFVEEVCTVGDVSKCVLITWKPNNCSSVYHSDHSSIWRWKTGRVVWSSVAEWSLFLKFTTVTCNLYSNINKIEDFDAKRMYLQFLTCIINTSVSSLHSQRL